MESRYAFRIGMLLLPGFNNLAAQAFIDPFRAANYLRAAQVFVWQYLSPDGGTVFASNGMEIQTTGCDQLGEDNRFDLVVVNASWTPEAFQEDRLQNWLKLHSRHGSILGGLDTGAFVLAYAGLLDKHTATVHFEHSTAFEELFPSVNAVEQLYVIDGKRISSCGGIAATDLALELIKIQSGIELANASARYIFHERLRDGAESQLPKNLQPVGYQVPSRLREAILLMERNIEEPLTQSELAHYLSISTRQMQRMFKQYIGETPIRHYLNIRLDRARGLVTQTELPIMDIAALCGFTRADQFSRAYSKRFDIAPINDRIEGRIPFQFRNFADHAAYHSVD